VTLLAFARAAAHETARAAADALVADRGGLPRRPASVDPTFLEHALDLPAGEITDVEVIDEHCGTTTRARLRLAYRTHDQMRPATVFVKATPTRLIERLFHNTMGLGEREVAVYRQLRELRPVMPAVYAAEWDRARGRSLIVMEDLGERGDGFGDLVAPVSPDVADQVVRALAAIHRQFFGSRRFDTDLVWLGAPQNRSLVLGPILSKAVLPGRSALTDEIVPDAIRRRATMLVTHSQQVADAWQRLPATLLHGDAHRGNLFIGADGVRFFDWQVASRGPAEQDLAYFLVTSLEPAVRATHEHALLSIYRDVMTAGGGPTIDPDRQWLVYRAMASRAYVAAVVTASFGARLQAGDIPRAGLERAVRAVDDLDTFSALAAIVER
jgi:hypothetical protein